MNRSCDEFEHLQIVSGDVPPIHYGFNVTTTDKISFNLPLTLPQLKQQSNPQTISDNCEAFWVQNKNIVPFTIKKINESGKLDDLTVLTVDISFVLKHSTLIFFGFKKK